MTSYFDVRESLIRDLSSTCGADGASFIRGLIAFENETVNEINLVTGDREFPHAWRERIQACIATRRLYIQDIPNERAIEYAVAVRLSSLLGDLHNLFHQLARERIETRFGWLTDNPRDILKRRDEHDEGPF